LSASEASQNVLWEDLGAGLAHDRTTLELTEFLKYVSLVSQVSSDICNDPDTLVRNFTLQQDPG